jgi:aminopeptidase N
MIQTLIGREGFPRGMDLYFAGMTAGGHLRRFRRRDGRRRGFRSAPFMRWYDQAGTPQPNAGKRRASSR